MRISSAVIVTLLVFVGVLPASPLTWNLTSIVLNDGTQITGSFVFDADTTTFSALSMTTTGGTTVPATSAWLFNTNDPSSMQNSGNHSGFAAVAALSADETNTPAIFLASISGPIMTDLGGTVTLESLTAGTCSNATCSTIALVVGAGGGGSGDFTNGVSIGGSAPEPSALIPVGSMLALAGLFGAINRRACAATRRVQSEVRVARY